MPWNTTQVEIRLIRAQREQDHHHHVAEIELCVKEQKGEQEAKAKENQRLADENFGNSRWPFCEHQYQHIARQPGQNIHIISKYAMSDQDCLLHDQLGLRIGKVRSILWNLMEYPETSRTAQVFLIYICTQSIERFKKCKIFSHSYVHGIFRTVFRSARNSYRASDSRPSVHLWAPIFPEFIEVSPQGPLKSYIFWKPMMSAIQIWTKIQIQRQIQRYIQRQTQRQRQINGEEETPMVWYIFEKVMTTGFWVW